MKNSHISNILHGLRPFLFILSSVRSASFTKERTITDLQVIQSPFGIEIDYRYNESNSEFGDTKSAPGCPKSIDGYPWIYYGKPLRCHFAGHEGPCGKDRLLFMEPGSFCGICGCSCLQDKLHGVEFETSADGRYTFCFGNQVQDNKLKMCLDLEKQGPCKPNQWLVKDNNGTSLICVQECSAGQHGPKLYDYQSGECFEPGFGGAFGGGSSGSLLPNECFGPERYSEILKKCVPKRPSLGFILG